MNPCTCHPGHTCTSVESCAAARRAEFGDVAGHEKRIREALAAGPVQYACHVDGDVDKSCAFDPGQNVYDCVLATRLSAKGLCKTDCNEWMPINAPKSTIEVSAANLRALLADLDAMRGALLKIARMAEDLKKPCSMDADSPQAIRNGQYMNICYAAHAALKGAAHE